jgi:hypothetical protein
LLHLPQDIRRHLWSTRRTFHFRLPPIVPGLTLRHQAYILFPYRILVHPRLTPRISHFLLRPIPLDRPQQLNLEPSQSYPVLHPSIHRGFLFHLPSIQEVIVPEHRPRLLIVRHPLRIRFRESLLCILPTYNFRLRNLRIVNRPRLITAVRATPL